MSKDALINKSLLMILILVIGKLLKFYVFRTRKAKRHHDVVHRGDYKDYKDYKGDL